MHCNKLRDRSISVAPPIPGGHSAYLEVIAYLKGVADAVATMSTEQGPMSLRPRTLVPISIAPRSAAPSWISVGTFPPHSLRFLSCSPDSTTPDLALRESLRFLPDGLAVESRFGELPHLSASAWPEVVVGSPGEPARVGARVIDFDRSLRAPQRDLAMAGGTMPYFGANATAAVAAAQAVFVDDNRASEVRLRIVPLGDVWYEIAGIDAAERRIAV